MQSAAKFSREDKKGEEIVIKGVAFNFCIAKLYYFVLMRTYKCTQEDSGVASPRVYSGGLCRILPGRILTCGHT